MDDEFVYLAAYRLMGKEQEDAGARKECRMAWSLYMCGRIEGNEQECDDVYFFEYIKGKGSNYRYYDC